LKVDEESIKGVGRMFPILGGRLLKRIRSNVQLLSQEFPILGGRLLKVQQELKEEMETMVSNPWREAIEEE